MNTPSTISAIVPRRLSCDEVYVKVGNFWYTTVGNKTVLILNAGDYHTFDSLGVHDPVLQVWCLGGSARLIDATRLERLGASDFRADPDDGSMDAKFIVPRQTLSQVAKIFSVRNKSDTFETSPDREIHEELFIETFPGRCDLPVLALDHAGEIRSEYRGTFVYQTPRPEDEGTNVHITRVFDLRIPPIVRRRLTSVKRAVYLATRAEMKSGVINRAGEVIDISRKARFIDVCVRGDIPLFSGNFL